MCSHPFSSFSRNSCPVEIPFWYNLIFTCFSISASFGFPHVFLICRVPVLAKFRILRLVSPRWSRTDFPSILPSTGALTASWFSLASLSTNFASMILNAPLAISTVICISPVSTYPVGKFVSRNKYVSVAVLFCLFSSCNGMWSCAIPYLSVVTASSSTPFLLTAKLIFSIPCPVDSSNLFSVSIPSFW